MSSRKSKRHALAPSRDQPRKRGNFSSHDLQAMTTSHVTLDELKNYKEIHRLREGRHIDGMMIFQLPASLPSMKEISFIESGGEKIPVIEIDNRVRSFNPLTYEWTTHGVLDRSNMESFAHCLEELENRNADPKYLVHTKIDWAIRKLTLGDRDTSNEERLCTSKGFLHETEGATRLGDDIGWVQTVEKTWVRFKYPYDDDVDTITEGQEGWVTGPDSEAEEMDLDLIDADN